jgi:Flp pilus assembly protein TadG
MTSVPPSILQRLKQDEAGSALIEGAIVVPVLCTLLFGVYEFSWFFYQQHLISTGLRDAARYLARLPAPCNPASFTWYVDRESARNLATSGSINGGAARVKGWTPVAVRLDCTPVENPVAASGLNGFRGGPVIYIVTASTRFTDPALGLFGLLGLRAPVIAVSHSERVTGPG